jgi:uncharacterized protein YecE (DUF72 family)
MVRTGVSHIGTSGWHYGHWRGPFYPDKLAAEEFLEFYAARFHTVEINNSFYQLPAAATLEHWRDTVPEGFIFAVKGSRYITHMKKLQEPEQTLRPLLERVELLNPKLGPLLFQLPPRWGFNPERLESFLQALPQPGRYALEFRDPSWINREACELLRRHNAAFCIYELAGYQSPLEVTADSVYIRLHGPSGAYQGQYGEQALAGWAEKITSWTGAGQDVFCYFDNDESGYAAQDALRLQEMLRPVM